MAAFEILAAEDPSLVAKPSAQAAALDSTKSVVTLPSAAPYNIQPTIQPPVADSAPTPQPPIHPDPDKSRRLWEMLVPPSVVYGALAIVVAGVLQFLSQLIRRRRPNSV
jgi:hypothetical protein